MAKYVAIKVGIPGIRESSESNILRSLAANNDDPLHIQPGKDIIPPVLDEFKLEGPNGTHQCLVTAPARMSAAEAREAPTERIFQLPVARAMAAQPVEGVAFLHSRGVVHGDLHPGNILLRLPSSIDTPSPSQLYERYGESEAEPAERVDRKLLEDGVPTHGVVLIWLSEASNEVTLTNSYEPSHHTDGLWRIIPTSHDNTDWSHTPLILRPPEQYLFPEMPTSYPSDI